MSYSGHHRSQDDACSPKARGSGVRASRDTRAAISGQATTSTHTPDRHLAAYPPGPGQTSIGPPGIRPASAPGTLLVCLTSSPSAEVATRYGGVSVAVTDVSPPDPGSHHDGLFEQRFIAMDRCR